MPPTFLTGEAFSASAVLFDGTAFFAGAALYFSATQARVRDFSFGAVFPQAPPQASCRASVSVGARQPYAGSGDITLPSLVRRLNMRVETRMNIAIVSNASVPNMTGRENAATEPVHSAAAVGLGLYRLDRERPHSCTLSDTSSGEGVRAGARARSSRESATVAMNGEIEHVRDESVFK
eukprot:IDg10800t1